MKIKINQIQILFKYYFRKYYESIQKVQNRDNIK